MLNLSHEPVSFGIAGGGRLLLSTELDAEGKAVGETVRLRADEGMLISYP